MCLYYVHIIGEISWDTLKYNETRRGTESTEIRALTKYNYTGYIINDKNKDHNRKKCTKYCSFFIINNLFNSKTVFILFSTKKKKNNVQIEISISILILFMNEFQHNISVYYTSKL